MDERYNTMVLDFHFEKLENRLFPTPHMAKSGGCNSSILHPFDFFSSGLFLVLPLNLNTTKDKGNQIKFYLDY